MFRALDLHILGVCVYFLQNAIYAIDFVSSPDFKAQFLSANPEVSRWINSYHL